jgi:amino acid transporter
MSFPLLRLLIGRPVGNTDAEAQKIGALAGLPAMGLDGLASAAYAPEAALAVLAVSGSAGLAAIGTVTWCIVILLGLLFSSYWQTIAAYPNNGGSYIVSSDNLGANAGLLAAAALMVDYLLNVAVGISAGVAALTSVIPSLHPHTLALCLGVLGVITLINLRGTRESGLAWAAPAYLFIGSLGVVICWGAYNAIAFDWRPQPSVALPAIPLATEPLSLWLALHAFASGCTAMTGVEAVSNGVSAFREPRVERARATLAAIVSILAVLLLGIAYVSEAYGVAAMDQSRVGYQSVLSQLVGAVFGRNWFYYLTMGSVLAVLCLSANTSFVGFPRLCHLMAESGFLPRPFAVPGRRLVYSVGILFLSSGAAALLIAFEGITNRLIPLFAVGAFLAFTLSQVGMAAHWLRALRRRNPTERPAAPAGRQDKAFSSLLKFFINGAGAIATGIALAIILAAKFTEGAWVTVIVIAWAIVVLRCVRRYYDEVDRQVLRGAGQRINLRSHAPPIVLVPISRWDRLSRRALQYALCISPEVTALHVINLEGPEAEERQEILCKEWDAFVNEPALRAGLKPPRLELVSSEYRSIVAPLLRLIQAAQQQWPGRPITIVLPELIEGHWWGYLMHANRERRMRKQLLRYGGADVVISSVPWQLEGAGPEEALADEEEQVGA